LIIWQQILSHARDHSFDLGSTQRSHLFGDGQTYIAAAHWAGMIGCSTPYIAKVIKKLEDLKLLKLIRMKQWRIVEISKNNHDDFMRLGNFHHDENINPTDEYRLTANGVSTDEYRLTDTEKTEVNGKVSTEVSTAAHHLFSFENDHISKRKDKRSAAVDTVSTEAKNNHVKKNQSQLIVTDELPEEQRVKRMAIRGVERGSDLLKNPALKKFHIHELIEFNDRLSELPNGVLTHKPRIGLISRHCVGKWRQMSDKRHRRHQFLETFLRDTDEIFDAIRRAEGAHDTNWFRFEWLLSFEKPDGRYENQYGEHNIEKLLSGRYQRLNEWVADQRRMKVENRTNYEPAGNLFDNDSFI